MERIETDTSGEEEKNTDTHTYNVLSMPTMDFG